MARLFCKVVNHIWLTIEHYEMTSSAGPGLPR
jgi:hypothetical protein